MFLAYCVEVKKELTPYQASRLQNANNPLTFQCTECKKPLHLIHQRRGFLNHPIFIRRVRENHESCLYTLYQTHLTETRRVSLEFETTLALIASTAQKLKKHLSALEKIKSCLQKERDILDKTHRGVLFLDININLEPSKQAYTILESNLRDIEKSYQRKN